MHALRVTSMKIAPHRISMAVTDILSSHRQIAMIIDGG